MKQVSGLRFQVLGLVMVVLALVFGLGGRAQEISFGTDAGAAKKGHISLASDDVTVEAGKVQVVELRFKVDEGFHINSHTPKDELLIATVLKLDEGAGVKVLGIEYPKGAAFQLGGGGDVLDVYQREFRVRVRLNAAKGPQTMTGKLHYQACDNAACFPPRDLAVRVALEAK